MFELPEINLTDVQPAPRTKKSKEELLAHFEELLGSKEENYMQVQRELQWCEYLTNEPVGRHATLIHLFKPEEIGYSFAKALDIVWIDALIIHGHEKEESCSAPLMCHVYGFQPLEVHNPGFRTIFYRKWGYLYGRNT